MSSDQGALRREPESPEPGSRNALTSVLGGVVATSDRDTPQGTRATPPLTSWRCSDLSTSGKAVVSPPASAPSGAVVFCPRRAARVGVSSSVVSPLCSGGVVATSDRDTPQGTRATPPLTSWRCSDLSTSGDVSPPARAPSGAVVFRPPRAVWRVVSSSVVSLLAQERVAATVDRDIPPGTRATPPLTSWRCSDLSTSGTAPSGAVVFRPRRAARVGVSSSVVSLPCSGGCGGDRGQEHSSGVRATPRHSLRGDALTSVLRETRPTGLLRKVSRCRYFILPRHPGSAT
jgi:hypothetical protein